ncbi:MAG: hypothetical protein QM763_00865 [Agriterribacter sp.]
MKYYLVVIVALLYSYQSFSQDSTLKMRTEIGRIKEKADTSRFTPDIKSGWSLFGSYMAMTGKDSVVLEAAISPVLCGCFGLSSGTRVSIELWV